MASLVRVAVHQHVFFSLFAPVRTSPVARVLIHDPKTREFRIVCRDDDIVLIDEAGSVETRMPVTAVRAVVLVRTKGK